MNNIKAHEILKEMYGDGLTENGLNGKSVHDISIFIENGKAQAEAQYPGSVTLEQLEAIARWILDRKGVAEGVDHRDERRDARNSRRIALPGDFVTKPDGTVYQATREELLQLGDLVEKIDRPIGFSCSDRCRIF